MQNYEVLFGIGFAIFFIAVWTLSLKGLSHASGWQDLSQRYHYEGDFLGKKYTFQSARMNNTNFNSCLIIGLSSRGLYLATNILFRAFHPALLIPWDHIQKEPIKQIFFKRYRLTIKRAPGVAIDLRNLTFERLKNYVK